LEVGSEGTGFNLLKEGVKGKRLVKKTPEARASGLNSNAASGLNNNAASEINSNAASEINQAVRQCRAGATAPDGLF
jgi:hypothetical protein